MRGRLILGLVLVAGVLPARTATRTRHAAHVTLRRRMFISPLIAEPGTWEFDTAVGYSATTGMWNLPTTLRGTPRGNHVAWGRTEFSANFDLADSTVTDGSRATQASDHVTLAATSVLLDRAHFDIAVQPLVEFWTRGPEGVRAGGIAIFRTDFGRNSVSGSVAWTGATAPDADNPAGIWDWNAGVARRLAAKGPLARWTAYLNAQRENTTGYGSNWSLFEGVEYECNDRIAFDVSAQQLHSGARGVDLQFTVGVTISFGGR